MRVQLGQAARSTVVSLVLVLGLTGCPILGIGIVGAWNLVRVNGDALEGGSQVLTLKVDGTYEEVTSVFFFSVTERGKWAFNPISRELTFTERTIVGMEGQPLEDETLSVTRAPMNRSLTLKNSTGDTAEFERK